MTSGDLDWKRLREIEARAAEATKGPWVPEYLDRYITGHVTSEHHTYCGSVDGRKDSVTAWDSMTRVDAHFIASSRDDIPWLVQQAKDLYYKLSNRDHELNVLSQIGWHEYTWTGRSANTCACVSRDGSSLWCGLGEESVVHQRGGTARRGS